MKRRLLPVITALAGVALVALLVYGVSHQAASRTLDEQVAAGHYPPAPNASTRLPILGGDGLSSFSSLRGKVVVAELLGLLVSGRADRRRRCWSAPRASSRRTTVTILGSPTSTTPRTPRSFVRQYHLSYPNLRDNTGSFAHSYGTDQLPESFVIDRQGRSWRSPAGEVNQTFLEHAVALAQSAWRRLLPPLFALSS